MKLRVALVAAVALSDCLDPTEIIVVVSTDVPCAQVNSTAIAIGRPGDDTNATRAKTIACSPDGGIGTLVATPSGAIDEDIGIRVTLGVGATQADGCVAPKFEGCIVARRSLRYDPHVPLTLPIDMQQICYDAFCDPNSTCVNGSCVDGGVTCDRTGTCALDAGVPDAGTCTDIAPTLVAQVSTPVTPHVVVTNSGYAVAYETASISASSRTYVVAPVDRNGVAGSAVPIANAIAVGTQVGPLGTDGTSFAATFEPTTSAFMVREIDPQGTLIKEVQTQASAQLPRAGMRYDAVLGAFVFFFIEGPNATFEVWPTGTSGPSFASVGLASMNDTALAYGSGSTYYGTFHDGSSCYLATGTLQVGSASATLGNPWSFCTTLRIAENAPTIDMAVTRETITQGNPAYTLNARASLDPTAAKAIVDAVDDQAIVVLPGVGNAFHVVYGASQTIRDTIIDTTLAFTPPKLIVSATGYQPISTSIGFDAVGEPGTMAHDVVFWASTPKPGVYFMRICN